MTNKELKKEIERLLKLKEETSKECWRTSQIRINLFKAEAKLEGYKLGQKEIMDKIDELDVDVMFTDIKDTKGNKIPESDNLMVLFGFFWDYMKGIIGSEINTKEDSEQ